MNGGRKTLMTKIVAESSIRRVKDKPGKPLSPIRLGRSNGLPANPSTPPNITISIAISLLELDRL
jgi:hypothetical protein